MDGEELRNFMKKTKRSKNDTERVVKQIKLFESFLSERAIKLRNTEIKHLQDYASAHEKKPSQVKRMMRALSFYFTAVGAEALAIRASAIRESLIVRKPLKLKEIVGVKKQHIQAFKKLKITNVAQMLEAGKTPELRRILAEQSEVPLESIEEFVHLSDLARIFAVKKIRARLYNDAGIDTVEKMAKVTPEELINRCRKFIEESGFKAIPPTPKEAEFTVRAAAKLPHVVEW